MTKQLNTTQLYKNDPIKWNVPVTRVTVNFSHNPLNLDSQKSWSSQSFMVYDEQVCKITWTNIPRVVLSIENLQSKK